MDSYSVKRFGQVVLMRLSSYIIRRLLLIIPVIIGVTLIVFMYAMTFRPNFRASFDSCICCPVWYWTISLRPTMRTPNVFVVQNNQWAISVPRSRQTAAPTIAQKACAYGFKGIQVDGNDLLAMYIATREAVERARKGDGPTLIEAYTYRMGNHTTSDDARKYREERETKEWELRDPILRMKAYMTAKGLLDPGREEVIWKEAREAAEKAVAEAEAFPAPTLDDIFRYTYETMPPELKAELERLRGDLKGGEK